MGLQVTIAGAKTAGFAVLSEGELARVLNHPPPGHQIIEELIESAQARWRALNAPHLVALVRAGARFEKAPSSNAPTRNQEVISKSRDTPIHRS